MKKTILLISMLISFVLAGCMHNNNATNNNSENMTGDQENMEDSNENMTGNDENHSNHNHQNTGDKKNNSMTGDQENMEDSNENMTGNDENHSNHNHQNTGDKKNNSMTGDEENMEDKEETSKTKASTKVIEVSARKFEFEPSTIKVQKGQKVRLEVTNEDVAHGIDIPQLGVSKKADAGENYTIEFTANKKGTFQFFCNVYCGEGHSDMTGKIIVQ